MLKEVIKHDGSVEDFNPKKLNKWAIWASDTFNDRLDWSDTVMQTIKTISNSIVTTTELQEHLIETCLDQKSWPYVVMAGRLYASVYRKGIYGSSRPPVLKELLSSMSNAGLMPVLDYSESNLDFIDEHILDHSRDFNLAHFQLEQIRYKYALSNKQTGKEYETPQFVYMRMALALAEHETDCRMQAVAEWYNFFSLQQINPPTPNYTNLGTFSNGYASCCLYKTGDNAPSLATGDHIAYTMTYMSAGIGGLIDTRSVNDPVRGGSISHKGKYPYFRSVAGAVKANLQGSRGGACTQYFSCYDPEVLSIIMYQSMKTPADKRNRDIHFGLLYNRHIVEKAYRNENIFTFTSFTAPDLWRAMFTGDRELFSSLYEQYEQNPNFIKNYVSARRVLAMNGQQSEEVATEYSLQIDEVNYHTSFKEPIHSSNLCTEICSPTYEYSNVTELYSTGPVSTGEVEITCKNGDTLKIPRGDWFSKPVTDYNFTTFDKIIVPQEPEVAMCSLASILVSNIHDDETYYQACYRALKMIDVCIHKAHYELPHIGYTARSRMNAGVGIVGLARYLAVRGLSYNTREGLSEIHRVAERHAYMVLKASLQLGKELGNAPWIHKTKWPEGWTFLDTYNRNTDALHDAELQYDWVALRQEIIDNGGIRNSSLIAHMPTESSSKASGDPNGLYPVRDTALKKLDGSNRIDWFAPDGDILNYQKAWDLTFEEMVFVYAIVQKFTDQSISADFYRDRTKQVELKTSNFLDEYRLMVKYGVKSKYYQNAYTVEIADGVDETKISCVGCDG